VSKKSSIEKNNRRKNMSAKHKARRVALKKIIMNKELPAEERFQASLKLAEMPRNGAPSRIRNRCELTGRPRGYYRKFRLCRMIFRDLASEAMIPGVTKSSW